MPLTHNGKYIEAENCSEIMMAVKSRAFYNNGEKIILGRVISKKT